MKYKGIAIGGHKAAGKDCAMTMIQEWIKDYSLDPTDMTIAEVQVIRCKTAMVDAFEKSSGLVYNKSMDAALMEFSIEAREKNPWIVSAYLWDTLQNSKVFTVIPDMRFMVENDMIRYNLGFFCVQVATSEKIRHDRILIRDGNANNFKPMDATEIEVPMLRYDYTVTNNRGPYELQSQIDVMMKRYFSAR